MSIFYNSRAVLILITIMLLGALSACAGNKIQPDYDTATDFGLYGTYQWKSEKPDKKTHVTNPFLHAEILGDIGRILKSKNLTKIINNKKADLIIDYQMSTETRQSSSNSSISFGTGSYGRGSSVGIGIAVPLGGTSYENEVTFIISMTDKKKNKIVWRAVNTETISANPASATFKNRLREIAKKIISTYPPDIKAR